MQAVQVKKGQRFTSRKDTQYKLQTFGDANDYPQQAIQIVAASITGKSCMDIFSRFINGGGFADENLNKLIVNRDGLKLGQLRQDVINDYSQTGGFAIHCNFNANGQVVEMYHVPQEHVRYGSLDDNGNFHTIATHPDWGRQYINVKKWDKDDIKYTDVFDPTYINRLSIEELQAYSGQIYYFSNKGLTSYPLPIFDNALTEMSTEEGVGNVMYRNARHNFLTAGMMVEVAETEDEEYKTNSDDATNTEREIRRQEIDANQTTTANVVSGFQGDESGNKILHLTVEDKDSIPTFIPFTGTNYDKEFTVTEDTIKDRIGRAFMQPPVLRSENVSAGFDTDSMLNAYTFYNAITSTDRTIIEDAFAELLRHWHVPADYDTEILPLKYEVEKTLADRLGDNGVEKVFAIMDRTDVTTEQKRQMIISLYKLTEDEAIALIPQKQA